MTFLFLASLEDHPFYLSCKYGNWGKGVRGVFPRLYNISGSVPSIKLPSTAPRPLLPRSTHWNNILYTMRRMTEQILGPAVLPTSNFSTGPLFMSWESNFLEELYVISISGWTRIIFPGTVKGGHVMGNFGPHQLSTQKRFQEEGGWMGEISWLEDDRSITRLEEEDGPWQQPV